MATVVRTSFGVLILNLQARLMARLEWPAERVLVLARKQLPFRAHGNDLLVLRGLDGVPQDEINDAGARVDNRCVRTISVTLMTRMALDEANSDLLWLTNLSEVSIGHYVNEHLIFDALVTYQPTDDAGNSLVTEPLRWRKVTTPEKDEHDNSWGLSAFITDVAYMLNLTLNADNL